MALPNKQEQAVLEELRGRVADVLTDEQIKDDMFLIRWLRARDLDVDKAADMLKNNIKWRRDNQLDGKPLREPLTPIYHDRFPCWVDGMDKEGRPIYTSALGKWDVRKVGNDGKSHEFRSYLTENYEEIMHAIKKSAEMHPPKTKGAPPINQIVAIWDWTDFAWSQLFSFQTVQNFLYIAGIYEAYYPEILYAGYFINSPALISAVVKLLKPVVAVKTMEKIVILGSDRETWAKEFLELIEADQIRPQFGGTKDNDDNPFIIS